jgi:hypothetical protein
VSVGPPGTSTFTVMALPSSYFAHTADTDSSAALAEPFDPADDEYPDKPPRMRWATYTSSERRMASPMND